jgi:MFS family permease
MAEFHISKEVSILTISFFVIGLGLGPLLLGPLSEFYGRWKVYVYSYMCLFGFTWGMAFAPNVGKSALHLGVRKGLADSLS